MESTFAIVVLITLVSTAVAAVLTGFCRKLTLVDIPNERSSHFLPTPRGGGVAIVTTSSIGLAIVAWLDYLDMGLAVGLLVGGAGVAIAGFLDDYRGLSARIRLLVHAAAAVLVLYLMDGIPRLQVGGGQVELSGAWFVVAVVAMVWVLNLFNFMDGIDGIAASEATFVLLAGGLLSIAMGVSSGIAMAAGVLAGSCVGFLVWNWPPAKIFMGDVGSGYIGFAIAVLVVAAAVENPVMIPVWLVLGAPFFVDATVTLVRRLLRGEPVHEAHRIHAYQWLARRWGSHRRVTVGLSVINMAILLPVAVWCALQPERSIFILGAVIVLFAVAALFAGAGKAERL